LVYYVLCVAHVIIVIGALKIFLDDAMAMMMCCAGHSWFWFRVESSAEAATEAFQSTDSCRRHSYSG